MVTLNDYLYNGDTVLKIIQMSDNLIAAECFLVDNILILV